MKLKCLTLICLIVLSITPVAGAVIVPFVKGEVIEYNIKKFGISAGQASLTYNGQVEVQGRQAHSISFNARGFQFLDEEQIYVDAQTFYPILIKRNLDIFGKEEKITEFYDPQKGKVRIVKIAKGKTTEQTIENSGQFDNIYGFIYRQRQLGQYKEGKELLLHLPTLDLQFKLAEQKTVSIADQEFNAAFLRSVPKKYEVWFDNSSNRIPLRIDGALGFGNLSMIYKDRRVNGQ